MIQQREDDEIVDVPLDAKSVGEIVMRGNIVMQEVGDLLCARFAVSRPRSTTTT